MKFTLRFILASLFFATAGPVAADQVEGFFGYDDRKEQKAEKKDSRKQKLSESMKANLLPNGEPTITWIRENIEMVRDISIDYLSEETAEAYLLLEDIMRERTDSWIETTQLVGMKKPWLMPKVNTGFALNAVDRGVAASKKNFVTYAFGEGGLKLLYFYSPSCPYCARLNPILARLARETGATVVLANIGDSTQEIPASIANLEDQVRTISAETAQSVARAWGVQGTPRLYLIDKNFEQTGTPVCSEGVFRANAANGETQDSTVFKHCAINGRNAVPGIVGIYDQVIDMMYAAGYANTDGQKIKELNLSEVPTEAFNVKSFDAMMEDHKAAGLSEEMVMTEEKLEVIYDMMILVEEKEKKILNVKKK